MSHKNRTSLRFATETACCIIATLWVRIILAPCCSAKIAAAVPTGSRSSAWVVATASTPLLFNTSAKKRFREMPNITGNPSACNPVSWLNKAQ